MKIVLQFWFKDITPAQWWKVDPTLDRLIADRFSEIHAQANRCELFEWRKEPGGRLAEIIVLDQFSRNIYRGTPLAFASDPLALALAQEAVLSGADMALMTCPLQPYQSIGERSKGLQVNRSCAGG
jgi:uncharacterized protein (DUF924 family)